MEMIQQEQGIVQATERKMEETLKSNEKKEYQSFLSPACCGEGMIGQIIYLLVISGINFVFIIVAIATSIKKNAAYLLLYSLNCPLDNIISDYLGEAASLLAGFSGSTESSFKMFWCGIGSFEDGVLISYLIFVILFVGFEIISLLIHKQVIKLSIEEEGILYYILVFSNSLFLVIFYIYIPLLLYLYIYCMIVLISTPNSSNNTSSSQSGTETAKDPYEESWRKGNAVPIINTIFVFLVFVFDLVLIKLKKSVILYLSMRYDNNNANLRNERTKKKTVRINNNNVEFEIQANQVTYLERVGQNDKIYKFKKVKINNITNDYIYLFLNNKAIDDQLSITDWEFPIFNELFLKLAKIANLIYAIYFISIPLFKLHLNNEMIYFSSANMYSSLMGISDDTIKKPTFYGVYSSYGTFELGTTNSRFALYTVALFFILLSMGKRIIYGGYTRPIIILICFIVSAVFVLENIIYVILSFLMILFSVFSVVCFYDMNDNPDDIIQAKFYLQAILNIIIFSICIRLLIDSIQLTTMLNKLRKEYSHLNDGIEPEEQEKIKGFKYKGLDNLSHILNEMEIEGHPRYTYYNIYGELKDVPPDIIPVNQNPITNPPETSVDIPINTHRNSHNNQRNQNNHNNQNNQNNQNDPNITNIGGVDLLTLKNENQFLRNENKKLNDELTELKQKLGNIYNSIHN